MDRCAGMSLSVHTLKRTHTCLEYPFTKDEKKISSSSVEWSYSRQCNSSKGAWPSYKSEKKPKNPEIRCMYV
ncbi:hypothetical protein Y032_0283g1323 [Ancylostoma ceylanicum]|uniref:Uncharacterized protein n=1 Tax=Ancylostoma ceylanicum TaxID=53326 RepID=A0A016S6X2_9BILA|nr:hypothetical protein Y032_0283g1323 [Ancylostoma ceylanicum]